MTVVVTRSGRQIKKPETYTPEENVMEDDYTHEDHDSEIDSNIDTDEEMYSDDDEEDDDEEDVGSLKDFIVDDDEDEDEDEE